MFNLLFTLRASHQTTNYQQRQKISPDINLQKTNTHIQTSNTKLAKNESLRYWDTGASKDTTTSHSIQPQLLGSMDTGIWLPCNPWIRERERERRGYTATAHGRITLGVDRSYSGLLSVITSGDGGSVRYLSPPLPTPFGIRSPFSASSENDVAFN